MLQSIQHAGIIVLSVLFCTVVCLKAFKQKNGCVTDHSTCNRFSLNGSVERVCKATAEPLIVPEETVGMLCVTVLSGRPFITVPSFTRDSCSTMELCVRSHNS